MNLSLLEEDCAKRITTIFSKYVTDSSCVSKPLQHTMSYSIQQTGKLLRPLLVYATGLTFGTTLENLDAPASAIECIHTFSLIHDDLPAMDNADLRRGKPSVHKAFGNALAILAGDALQTLAFNILASHPSTLTAKQRIAMIKVLAEGSGMHGMTGGQALDITGVNSIETLLDMYALKTGQLLIASVKLGLIASDLNESDQQPFITFAKDIGLAFQIQDDLLDLKSSAALMGKNPGADRHQNKLTYPQIVGIEEAYRKVDDLFSRSMAALSDTSPKAPLLISLAEKLIHRRK